MRDLNGKKIYISQKVYNAREEIVQKEYESRGFVVLKRGWPDLFCYNHETKQVELVEVKSKSQYHERVNKQTGKVHRRLGLSRDQMRMHQYLKNIGLKVKIIWVE